MNKNDPWKIPAAINRRNAVRLLAAGALGGAASLVNGCGIEPGLLSVTRADIFCGKLPPALEGLRSGLLADFHYRPENDADLLQKVVVRVRSEKLDLIALAGDFMSDDPGVMTSLLAGLEKMSATHGVFAVMGNHDGWSGHPARIRRQFEKAGISFLINQHSLLSIGGDQLAVAGTDFVWLGKPDPQKTLAGIGKETPVLALVHEPDYFDAMTAHRDVLLQLSGHSHGGQCRVPLLGYAPVKVKYGTKYLHGTYSRGDSKLFVTRGVGTTGLRIRFACPPELAVLTLRAAVAG